jgi:hypothetical protein
MLARADETEDQMMTGEKDWTCPDRAEPLISATEETAGARTKINPYPIPNPLPEPLGRLLDHWNRLKRGNADIPFADDVALGAIAPVGEFAFLIDVFANPLRFRFGEIGAKAREAYARDLGGRFLGEIERHPPLDFVLSQCDATMEARAPTYYAGTDSNAEVYHRLLLPLWADGRIAALLGAIVC